MALLLIVTLVASPNAFAIVQWTWTYGANTYQTKAQAVAAMQAAAPQNSVLTQELPPSGMSSYQVQFQYVAPPVSPSFSGWVYQTYCPGGGACNYSTLAAAVTSLEAFVAAGCGPGTATPTSDWINESGLPDTLDYENYTVTWDSYNDYSMSCSGTGNDLYTIIERSQTAICPTYYHVSGTAPYCIDTDTDSVYGVPNACPASDAPGTKTGFGNPCDASTGDKTQSESDYSGPLLNFTRYYHSATLESSHTLGVGWTHNFAARLIVLYGQLEGLVRPDGHHDPLTSIGGEFVSESGASIHVQASGSNWIAFLGDGSEEVYDPNGNLLQLVNPGGQVTTLNYNSDGTLASVVGPFGQSLQFGYTNGVLTQLTDPAGQTIQYAYDTHNNLATVTYQDLSTRTYEYENTSFPNHLTGITDESSTRFATFGFDSIGRAVSSQHSGGADAVSIVYGSSSATVTDAIGGTTVLDFTNQAAYTQRVTSVVHNGLTRSYVVPDPSIDIQQRITQMTDENGNVATYAYDPDHLTSKTEASGSTVARTTGFQYLATNTALPTLVTEALRQTSYAYYSGTNNIQTKTITDTTVTPNVSRTWTYTYDGYGRVLTVDGPRTDATDVTTYAYYTCTSGTQCGQIHTVTNALGHVTTYSTYNAHGQPLTLSDANGVVTMLTYDLRQRLVSRQVGTETTGFAYYPTGLLQKVTLPDGSFTQYTYDAAHRLTTITDRAGNYISYTLDGMGNRTAENTYDPSSVLHRAHTRVYNTLNQLYQDLSAAGTSAVTTTYGYDNNGNQTSINAPLSRNTLDAYDQLNRLNQITDPASGVTKFGYDANDSLTSVKDPNLHTTSYTNNGFGDVTTLVSPDTGATTNTYDSGGNLATSTDARSAISTYVYDALNRATSVAYKKGTTTDQTIAFTYDAGTYGKGRLTGASDSSHSMSWVYDALGRVTGKGQTVGTVTKSVGYAYTNADLVTLTTPSGQTLTYGYNTNHQVVSITLNGATTILNNATYEPLGSVNGWSWGNGALVIRSYNTDGLISQISATGTKTLTHDNALRITGLADTSTGASSWTYGYDLLDRITSAAGGSTTRGWTYDANGNRKTETGSAASTYTMSASNNRITSITGALPRTYTYDATGHFLTYSTITGTYNDRGRLKSVKNGTVTESLLYNAVGQMMSTTGGAAGAVLYMYDEAGHLLGEYSSTGALVEETVWLGDTPVATLRPSGSSVAVYYVEADHLNTPRQVTRPSDNAQMWTWFSDPFGTTAANSNPAGAGAFTYNLRFPGQIYDSQAGLQQNYFRDYDPAIGRYAESDPVSVGAHALLGMLRVRAASVSGERASLVNRALATADGNVSEGRDLPLNAPIELNTYAYAAKNPLTWTDPTGLLVPPGGGGGDSGSGTDCRLVGQFVMALKWKAWLPAPFAVVMCIYDCNTSCPGSGDNILMKTRFIFNPPYVCLPTYRRRLGE
jgi:RHS repeat-associated protein